MNTMFAMNSELASLVAIILLQPPVKTLAEAKVIVQRWLKEANLGFSVSNTPPCPTSPPLAVPASGARPPGLQYLFSTARPCLITDGGAARPCEPTSAVEQVVARAAASANPFTASNKDNYPEQSQGAEGNICDVIKMQVPNK
ncbi:hypothetical protein SKAU_G00349080 [Synaphobranchus kaupii]|uniref:Uncharacterized protein n=1 Tax=Synaphobranchus kaupii TaxID=118154 RepID=A0A9Q1IH18_SYNKA|nr:hypothetical protein SKAU_G00349080 [Synaphobranchus kaupii]